MPNQKENIGVEKGGMETNLQAVYLSSATIQPPFLIHDNIKTLIQKYWQIVKAPNHSPYFLTKKEENQSIIIKIKELKNIK